MNNHKPINAMIPGLGQRSLKTAFAAAIIALIYLIIGRSPAFACIGVIFGIGNDLEDSKKNGGNRLIGTIIGGLLGIGIFWVEHSIFPAGNYYLKVVLLFLGFILLVWSSIVFKWPGAVQPGGVVLCIILFDTPANYTAYAFGRMIDTAIGVVFAIAVNTILKRSRVDRWLKREATGETEE